MAIFKHKMAWEDFQTKLAWQMSNQFNYKIDKFEDNFMTKISG